MPLVAGPGLPPQPLVMTLQLDTGPLLTPFIPTVFGTYTYLNLNISKFHVYLIIYNIKGWALGWAGCSPA